MDKYTGWVRTFGAVVAALAAFAAVAQENAGGPVVGGRHPFFAMDTGLRDDKHATPEARAATLKELGYDGSDHSGCAGLAEELAALDGAGLRLFAVYLGLSIEPDSAQYDPLLDESLPLLKDRGVILWMSVSSSTYGVSSPDGDARAVEVIGALADKAKPYGVRIALYPHINTWLERVEDAVRVAKAVNRDNVGVTFNLFHWMRAGDRRNLWPLLQQALPYLYVATVNGTSEEGSIETLDQGTCDMSAVLLESLGRLGYAGPIGLQGYGIGGDVRENLARSISAWRRFGASSGSLAAITRNSHGMPFVRIEPGRFAMGQEQGGDWDERPVHNVTISQPFLMGVTEVTNAQYERFAPDHRALRGRDGLSNGDDEAVVYVSWHEAAAFCVWLSAAEGRPYRLPTEAEWEYACRAGTTTPYNTGDALPEAYCKHQSLEWQPVLVDLRAGQTPPNAWGLCDMHGNVEEWCFDGYGPYLADDQTDPVGYADADFKVTRGGSHTTEVAYLRSANRLGTLPEDKHTLIGFRVVQAPMPVTAPLPNPATPLWAQRVSQTVCDWSGGPDPATPYFHGPVTYVNVPPGSDGPLFSKHNHCPALTACPNGDLLAIWYTTRTEQGRELAITAARLRRGAAEWDAPAPFWDAPDRNDHASALLWDGQQTLFHFNGLSSDATWGKLALILRTSIDNGATWSKARIVDPDHGLRNMPIAGVFMTREGYIVLPCDAATGGKGGTAVHVSRDGGATWVDPGRGKPAPTFKSGETGAWIAGIHAAVAQGDDGSLLAFGRGDAIDGKMAMSRSQDMGATWTYASSVFPPVAGGQRPVLRKLCEGPLFFASFAKELSVEDAAGVSRTVSGLFGALSYDNGATWTHYRLITDDGPDREVDGGGNTGPFTLGPNTAEHHGYMACTQTPDGVIHLISSKQYYAFNLKWLETPMPAGRG